MRYIFFGTPKFASIILEKMISAGLPPIAIVTNPDRPAGRNKILTAPPVKELACRLLCHCEGATNRSDCGNLILQPEKFDAGFAQQLESYNADVFVVAAYGKILPEWIINMPPKKTVGVHPSLLPKYRGPSPIQTAILNGDKETGVTLYILDEGVDSGPTLANFQFSIFNFQTYETLEKKLAKEGGKLLAETLPKYVAGEIAPHPQDEEKATYTKKITSENGFIPYSSLSVCNAIASAGKRGATRGSDPAKLRNEAGATISHPSSLRGATRGSDVAISFHRKILALNPEPGVYTITPNGQRVKLLEADLKDGKLILKKIQRAGKKPEDFVVF